MHVRVVHQFENVSVDRFVEVYYSEDYNRKVAGLASLAVRELVDIETLPDGKVKRRVRMEPEVKLPAVIRRLLRGAPIEYFEVSTYDPNTHAAKYAIESAAGDLVKVWGTLRFTPDEEGGVAREIDGQVEVKIPALGRIIERLIGKEVRGRYDKIQSFTQRYLDEHLVAVDRI